jgi:hypothetical protein
VFSFIQNEGFKPIIQEMFGGKSFNTYKAHCANQRCEIIYFKKKSWIRRNGRYLIFVIIPIAGIMVKICVG